MIAGSGFGFADRDRAFRIFEAVLPVWAGKAQLSRFVVQLIDEDHCPINGPDADGVAAFGLGRLRTPRHSLPTA